MENLILIVAVFMPTLLILAGVLFWRRFVDRDNRRSPINIALYHQPGEQIRQALDKVNDTFYEYMAVATAIGPLFLAGWLLARLKNMDWSAVRWGWGDTILLVTFLIMIGWTIQKIIFNGRERRRLQQGLQAELATAQCLMPLIGEGCYLLHDIPADKFNIDHVVIGPCAVFAVESKSRKKPSKGGKDNARVHYDGRVLKFPEHAETAPLEQAARQARWLQNELYRAIGKNVKVVPVLSLPGWFVDGRGGRDSVIVHNCRNPKFMLSESFGSAVDDSLRKLIVHALVQRYPKPDEKSI